MRLSLFTLLMVGAFSPALAADPVPAEREAQAADQPEPRIEMRSPPPRRFERAERDEAPSAQAFERRARRAEGEERVMPDADARPAPDPVRDVARAAVQEAREDRPAPVVERPPRTVDDVAGWRWRERDAERRGRGRDVPPTAASPVFGGAVASPDTISRPRREPAIDQVAQQPSAEQLRNRIATEGWRQDWRRDRRYDWRRHRDRDRDRYHRAIYLDPFGWDYRSWDIGWRLPSRCSCPA